MDVEKLSGLLHETAEHHDAYEKIAPPHDWWDWYAAYLAARMDGADSGRADKEADTHMAEAKNVVAPPR